MTRYFDPDKIEAVGQPIELADYDLSAALAGTVLICTFTARDGSQLWRGAQTAQTIQELTYCQTASGRSRLRFYLLTEEQLARCRNRGRVPLATAA